MRSIAAGVNQMIARGLLPHGGATCATRCMDHDDATVNSFLERLDRHELNGHLNYELSKLSYDQLLRVSQILAKRVEKQGEK